MSAFTPSDAPRVFALPPGADFAADFLAGLLARIGPAPEALAKVEILVNTQRTRRRMEAVLASGGARLMPRLRVLSEIGRDAPGLPAPIPPLRRRLELAQLVAALIRAEPDLAPRAAAYDLADALAGLMDEMQGEGVGWEALEGLDHARLAGHWQSSLQFLRLIRAPLAAGAGGDPEARQRAAVEALVARWKKTPPEHPVIVAGSTGSRGATAMLMAAVARLPQGALVLPGFDFDLPAPVWQTLLSDHAADHPQFGFARLAELVGFEPSNVPLWHEATTVPEARNRLISLTLRPAPVTHQWLSEGPALVPELAAACADLTLIEAADQRQEALAVALCLRGALERGEAAALVTPDRGLTRRVAALMDRWRIAPDDSAGRPLAQTPPGVLIRHISWLMGVRLTPEDLLITLKHPLVASAEGARGPHLGHTRALEIERLCGGAPFIDWDDLTNWAAGREGGSVWLGWLRGALEPLAARSEATLADHVAAHMQALDTLAAGPDPTTAPTALWLKDAGEAALTAMTHLQSEAAAGGTISLPEYRTLIRAILDGEVPDAPYTPHPGVAIWGTLEARTQRADLVILGGLNEGAWPRMPPPDPWLNREMRAAMGLPMPERRIGLSAHDFQQAMGARQVVLSRAARDAETPLVASRWLMRLSNLLDGLGVEGQAALAAARARGQALTALADQLDEPLKPSVPAQRPAPRPPIAARPTRLSVTKIETLVRDPYAIYARYILKLKPLDPPGRSPDALARGIANHAVLERFTRETRDVLPPDAAKKLIETAQAVLKDKAPWPAARRIWLARLSLIADWFIEGELARRALGAPEALEVRGERAVTDTFLLSAIADRIDRMADGRLAIFDYKSGALPSGLQMQRFNRQVYFEAAIAEAGGFAGIAATEVGHLELITLGSGGKTRPAPLEADGTNLIHRHWAELGELIGAYATPTRGYPARTIAEKEAFEGDYDHLSRRGEWEDGDPITYTDVGLGVADG